MRFFKALFLLILFVAAMLFFIQNMQTLSAEIVLVLNLFVFKWQSMPLPTYWMILGPFALGCLIMIFYFGLEKLRLSQDLRAAQSQVAQLTKELEALRPAAPAEAEGEPCCQQAQ